MIETYDEFKKRFGIKLKKYRTLAGLTQESLAEKCDCSYQTLSGAETGRTFPSSIILYKLSESLDVPLSHMFNFYFEKLTQNEDDLIILNAYNKLDEEKKKFVLNMINYLNEKKV